jgi:predicted Fe-Mo cluster-binding NifX family protein
MVSRARRVVALVTARKFREPSRIMAVPVDRVDTVIAEGIGPEDESALRSRGVELILATGREKDEDLPTRSSERAPNGRRSRKRGRHIGRQG